ncbi:hypothetical protein B0H34DRAFT_728176 [Crassisporium funariophilum]|nr:hypothetical protein B0H34DRAFT_728176 [Crassisporium funariophilum]
MTTTFLLLHYHPSMHSFIHSSIAASNYLAHLPLIINLNLKQRVLVTRFLSH